MKSIDALPRWIAAGLVGFALTSSACTGSLKGDGPNGLGPSGSGGSQGSGGVGAGATTSAGGPTLVTAADCKADSPENAGAGRWRRLTATQYRSTIRDLLGLDAENGSFLQD